MILFPGVGKMVTQSGAMKWAQAIFDLHKAGKPVDVKQWHIAVRIKQAGKNKVPSVLLAKVPGFGARVKSRIQAYRSIK